MLLAGQVGKPHGITGEVYVVPISDDARRFEPGSTLWRDDGSTLVIEAARRHTDRLLVRFEGIGTRDDAELLRGPLYIPPTELRDLEPDEFWPHDLEGCEVVISDGSVAGTVTAIVGGAAQDLMEIATERGPRLIPFVKEIIVGVDLDARRVTIDPPEGLLE